jgi:hypothetical protein
MSKKKVVETTRNGFRLVWQMGEPGMIDVNVYAIGGSVEPVIEWSYPKVAGNSLIGNIALWEEQAVLEARRELELISYQPTPDAADHKDEDQ